MIVAMKTMIISEFKAKCIAVMKHAQQTNEPVLVTLRGRSLARIEPVSDKPAPRKLGALRGWMKINGDIILAQDRD